MARILIDENKKIVDKEKARTEFKKAYAKSLAAKKAPSSANEDDLYLFADKVSELREVMLVDNVGLTHEASHDY